MAECADEVPLDEYYTAPFTPDRTIDLTPLIVPDVPSYVASHKFDKKRKRFMKKKAPTMRTAELYETFKSFLPERKGWIRSLQKQIYDSEENRRCLDRSNRSLTEENERLQAQIEALTSQESCTNERLREMKHMLGTQYCSREGLDSRRKRKEDVIHNIAAASRRLEDDYQRKTTLRMQTDSDVQNLLPRNRNLLMHALDYLHNASWTLNEVPSNISEIQVSSIPDEELAKIISDADDEISRFQLALRLANWNLEKVDGKLKKETEELEKSKIDLDIFSTEETCLRQVATIENIMKSIISLIFKAREAVEQSYRAIEDQERELRKKKAEHNKELRKAYFQSSQRRSRARSFGGYPMMARRYSTVSRTPAVSDYFMRGEVLCDLPYKPTYSDPDNMLKRLQEGYTAFDPLTIRQYQDTVNNMLRAIQEKETPTADLDSEVPTVSASQSSLRAQQYREAINRLKEAAIAQPAVVDDLVSEATIEQPAVVDDLVSERMARRHQSSISEHARRRLLAQSQRAEAAALAARVPADSTFSQRRSLEGIRGRTATFSRLAQNLPAGEGQTPVDHARRASIGHEQRTPSICQRLRSRSVIG